MPINLNTNNHFQRDTKDDRHDMYRVLVVLVQ